MEKKLFALLSPIFVAVGLFTTGAISGDVSRMTKDELKAMLGNPGLLILDVRLGRDFIFSDLKIKGADRPLDMSHVTPAQFPENTKDKTIVFYCASPNEEGSAPIAQLFIERGFTKVYVLKGGWEEWLKAEYLTEKK
ncbi:MAG: rhodanese-related (seleno)protein [Pseudomonadota bacterium]